MTATIRRTMTQRMKGAALLEIPIYEEVEADTGATGQAAGVVSLAAVCAAIGGALGGPGGLLVGLISVLLGWVIWSGVTYFIGTRLFGGTATWGELMRTIGFAWAPGVLYIIGFVPVLGGFVRVAVSIWILIAGVIAIRQALDFGTGRALLTAVVGFIPYIFLIWLVGAVLGIPPQLL